MACNRDVATWEDWTRGQADDLWTLTDHQKHGTTYTRLRFHSWVYISHVFCTTDNRTRNISIGCTVCLEVDGIAWSCLLGIDALDQDAKGRLLFLCLSFPVSVYPRRHVDWRNSSLLSVLTPGAAALAGDADWCPRRKGISTPPHDHSAEERGSPDAKYLIYIHRAPSSQPTSTTTDAHICKSSVV